MQTYEARKFNKIRNECADISRFPRTWATIVEHLPDTRGMSVDQIVGVIRAINEAFYRGKESVYALDV